MASATSGSDAWASAVANPTAKLAGTWAAAAGTASGAKPAASAATKAAKAAVADSATRTFTTGAVNRTVVGGAPTGSWAPSTAQTSATGSSKGTTSAAPAASAAAVGTNGVAAPAAIPTSGFGGAGASGAGLGEQAFYGLESFPLSSAAAASVNLANGNLILHSQDVSFNAPGLSVHLDQFFNTLNTGAGAAGPGGSLSTGQDVGLKITGSPATTVTFYGPSGFTAAFTANGSAWTAPAGINADLVHNSDGTWALTYHATGEKLSFTSGGYLVSDVDRNGIGLMLSYDSSNRLTSVTDADGRVTALAYGSNGYLSTITDPVGRKVTYTYFSGAGVKTITYPDASVLTFDNSLTGGLDKVKSPNGYWTAFTRDSSGRITKVQRFTTAGATSGAAATTSFAYPSSTSTTETNPLGGTSTYTLDSLGRVTKVVDPLGHSRSTTWTPNSDVATAVDAMGSGTTPGNTLTYSYDTVNNRTAVALPTGAAAKAVYATGGACTGTTGTAYEPKCSTDAAGNTKAFTYDGVGNVLSVKDTTATGSGGTGATPATYTYQSSGSGGTQCGGKVGQICTSTNGDAKVTSYTYDSNGNLTKVTPPSPLGATTYTYDGIGRVATVTDGKAQKSTYTYDAGNRITQVTLNSGTTIKDTYDGDGNLTQSVDSANGTTTYGYDGLDRENYRQAPNMSGNALTTSYDAAGDVTSTDDIYGSVTYTYNTAEQLTKETQPVGSGTESTTFTYDANGRELTRVMPNGVTQTTSYDKAGRTTEIKATGGGYTLTDFLYSYTAPGTSGTTGDRALIQTRTDNAGIGVPAGSLTTYTYDGLARLKTATEKTSTGATNASWAYTYDAAGNRTGATTVGAATLGATASTPSATTTWGYNAANEITSRNSSTTGWTSDANGNQSAATWGTATYNDSDGLTALTPAGSSTAQAQTYAGTGNSDRLSTAGTSTIQGALGLVATFSPGSSSGVAFRYTPNGQILSSELPDGTTRYYLTDIQGSVVSITNSNSTTANYTYDPYGNTRAVTGSEAGDNPLRYTSSYTDSNSAGLYHDGARYYDPTTARFTQQDPSGLEANSYAYTGDNPINFVDLSGTSARAGSFLGAAAGLVVAAAATALICTATAGAGCVVAGIAAATIYPSLGALVGTKAGGGTEEEADHAAEDTAGLGLIGSTSLAVASAAIG